MIAGLPARLLAFPALLLAHLLALVPAQAAEPVPQVVLIQDSGWMEPFLTADGSQFRPLVEALAAAARAPGGTIAVAAFDQDGQVPGRTSPRILYEGPYDAARVRAAVAGIDLPRKASGAYADADLDGALVGAIRLALRGRAGVIWMVTNNKNAPGNDPAVARNTAAFYAALRNSDAITRIVAYPVRMPLKGRTFSEGGFVVYGIGYGAAGGQALDAALAGAPMRALFSHPPVRIKPLLAGGLALRFEGFDGGGLRAVTENGVLVVRGADAARGAALRLTGRLHNGLYPQRVVDARLSLTWTEIGAQAGLSEEAGLAEDAALAKAAIAPARIEGIAPGADSGPLSAVLTLPPVPRPPGLAGLLAGRRTVDGTLSLRLADLRLALDPAFLERVRPIFASSLLTGRGDTIGDAAGQGTGQAAGQAAGNTAVEGRLPDLFLDFKSVSETAVTLPVRIEAEFSPWPLIGASAGALALAGAAGAGAAAGMRARTLTVMLGSFPKRATLKPFRPLVLRAPDGSRWRVRAGLWGPARATRLADAEPGARA
ncbi:hypothetical protein Q8W71_20970 [Methylobacterium sp. NEAU 140]|uniref:hypothetical protein n=1 Tax=Methylobacterium sp. NEAU 140 TaxID=3064945 RepID=UPI002733C2E4|nr:hypothetical protein [Methylobacterium sp. NEAU 140]MDP4025106.1 hypothetical protein [Methylobacterium sp. NEAU 140]